LTKPALKNQYGKILKNGIFKNCSLWVLWLWGTLNGSSMASLRNPNLETLFLVAIHLISWLSQFSRFYIKKNQQAKTAQNFNLIK